MRFILSVVILTAVLTGCSTTAKFFAPAEVVKSEPGQPKESNQLIVQYFNELDSILAIDLKSRDLTRAKYLVVELKAIISDNSLRLKELSLAEQWINESVDSQVNINRLKKQTRKLETQASKYKEALKQVRQMLVSE